MSENTSDVPFVIEENIPEISAENASLESNDPTSQEKSPETGTMPNESQVDLQPQQPVISNPSPPQDNENIEKSNSVSESGNSETDEFSGNNSDPFITQPPDAANEIPPNELDNDSVIQDNNEIQEPLNISTEAEEPLQPISTQPIVTDAQEEDNNEEDNNESDEDSDYDPEMISYPSVAVPTELDKSNDETSAEVHAETSVHTNNLQSVLSALASSSDRKQEAVPDVNLSKPNNNVDLQKILASIAPSRSEEGSKSVALPQIPDYPSDREVPIDPKYAALAETLPQLDDASLDADYTEEEQMAYQQYLNLENEYVGSGDWDRFPPKSRMFVGNLQPSLITKHNLFKIFYRYGGLAQISIKNGYGFIQFCSAESCECAMAIESTRCYKGGKHFQLELSKKQGRRNERKRARSPSPGRYRTRGGRDNNGRQKGNNKTRGGRNNYRERSRSPRRGKKDVPECQIFVLDGLDPGFVRRIVTSFSNSNIVAQANDLPQKVSLKNAIHDLVYDGVLGVVTLDYKSQRRNCVNLQVFERNQEGGVKYDEYLNIEVHVAVELLVRAKHKQYDTTSLSTSSSSAIPPYYGGQSNYSNPISSLPQVHQQQPHKQQLSNPTALLSTLQNLDPTTLQSVVAALVQPQAQQQVQQPMYGNQYSQPQAPQNTSQYNPQYQGGNVMGGYPYQSNGSSDVSGQQSNQQVQNIMEQLAKLQGNISGNSH